MGAGSSTEGAPAGDPNENTSLTGKGPKDLEGRRCTDVLCLLLFVFYWAVGIGLGVWIFVAGDANKVFHGTDYMGNPCGHTTNTSSKPKIFYPRIAEDMLEQSATLATGMWWDINLYGVCVESCPQYDETRIDTITDYGYGWAADAQSAEWGVYMSTVDLFNRCLQHTEANTAAVDLCTIPNCTQVGATCYQPVEIPGVSVPSGAWQLGLDATLDASCAREIALSTGTTVKQPGANSCTPVEIEPGLAMLVLECEAHLDWLFLSVGTIKDSWESITSQWGYIFLFGVVFALLINFIWLILLYFFAFVAVWASIISVLAGLFLGAIFCFVQAGALSTLAATAANTTVITNVVNVSGVVSSYSTLITSSVSADDQWLYWVAAIVLSVFFLIFAIIIMCSCSAIRKCIVLVSEGSLALGSSSGLAIMPIFIATFQTLVFSLFVLTMLVLTTVGTDGTFHERLTHTSPTVRDIILGLYLLFGAIWTYAFLTALELMTVAGCVFYFYFVNKSTVPESAYMKQYDDNQTRFPVLTHLGWVCRYHLGTIAFGSLIIAIITLIQIITSAIFKYLEKQTSLGENPLAKLAFRCVECCLWCFKKTIEFINSYAYIYCFVENIGFCSGCMRTFQLILSYPAQIAINTSVQRVLALLLSLTTPLICGTIAFLWFDFIAADAASHGATGGMLLPGSVVIIALLLSRAFAAIWEQVIQSLTVCVLHDVDNFDGRFLRPSMQGAFGDPKKADKVKQEKSAPAAAPPPEDELAAP